MPAYQVSFSCVQNPRRALVALLSFALLSMTVAQMDGNESYVPDSLEPSQIPETPPVSPRASPRRTRSRVAAASGGAAGPPSRAPSPLMPTIRYATDEEAGARMQNRSDNEAGAREPRSNGKEPKNETSTSKPQAKHPKSYGAYGASQSQGAACGSKKRRARDDGEGCSSQSPGGRFTMSGRASRPGSQYFPSANIREGEAGCTRPVRCNGAAAGWSELAPPAVELVSLPDARPTRKHWNKKWVVTCLPKVSRDTRIMVTTYAVQRAANDRDIFGFREGDQVDMETLRRRRDRIAVLLHPDKTWGLEENLRADAHRAMLRVNEAFERMQLMLNLSNGVNVFEGIELIGALEERFKYYDNVIEGGGSGDDVRRAKASLQQAFATVLTPLMWELLASENSSPQNSPSAAGSNACDSEVLASENSSPQNSPSAAGSNASDPEVGEDVVENEVIDLRNSTDEDVAEIDAAVARTDAEEAVEEAAKLGDMAHDNPELADVAADAAATAHAALDAAVEARQVADAKRAYARKKKSWISAKQRKKDLKAVERAELEERNFKLGRDSVRLREYWNDLTPQQQEVQNTLWQDEYDELFRDVQRLKQRLRRATTKAERLAIQKEIAEANRLADEHVCRWNFARDLPLTRTHTSCLRLYQRLMALDNPYWNTLNGDDDDADEAGDDDADKAGGGGGG